MCLLWVTHFLYFLYQIDGGLIGQDHIISYHIISYHITSHHNTSYHIMAYSAFVGDYIAMPQFTMSDQI